MLFNVLTYEIEQQWRKFLQETPIFQHLAYQSVQVGRENRG